MLERKDCTQTICIFFFIACPLFFFAQQNLVPNGLLRDFTKDSLGFDTDVKSIRPLASDIDNWELNKCQTYYTTDAGNSATAFVTLILYNKVGPNDFEVWNAVTSFCRPLTEGKTYLVNVWLKPLTGTAYSGGISVAFSDKMHETKHYYEVPKKGSREVDVQPGIVPAYKHHTVIGNSKEYTNLVFEYTAKGGEEYIYIGNFNIGKPDVWKETIPFGYMRPAFDYSAFSIYALGGVSVIPKDMLELVCNTDSIHSSDLYSTHQHTAARDTVYLGAVYFESDVSSRVFSNSEVLLRIDSFPDYARVLLLGYADESGGAAYNKELSLKRAEHVARLMANKFSKQIVAVGLGISSKNAEQKTERRVEVYLIK